MVQIIFDLFILCLHPVIAESSDAIVLGHKPCKYLPKSSGFPEAHTAIKGARQ